MVDNGMSDNSADKRNSAGVKFYASPMAWWGRCLRRILVPCFFAVGHAIFKVNIRGIVNFTNRPGTLVVANHKSDFDTIIFVPILYYSQRGRGPVKQMRFVAAEQMFEPGYVSTYLLENQWTIFRRFLYPANMSALFKGSGAHPIPGSRQRKLGRHLRVIKDIEGNLPLKQVLDSAPESIFPGANGDEPISSILRWKYHRQLNRPCGTAQFKQNIAIRLRQAHVQEMENCLQYFGDELDAGGAVYIAPEGGISTEGNFRGVKAGLSRLIHGTENQVTLLPINFTYDTMTTGRGSVFMNIGQQITGVQTWERRKIEDVTATNIGALSTVTLPQLIAEQGKEALVQGDYSVAKNDLRKAVFDRAARLHEQNIAVDDRLLDQKLFDKRFVRFIKHCLKKNLARRKGKNIIFTGDDKNGAAGKKAWWQYGFNELEVVLKSSSCQ